VIARNLPFFGHRQFLGDSMRTAHLSIARQPRAFTIIELIVVVGIIVLLLSILIPAVGAARSSSRKTATSTQMRNIALACESYYQIFRAYPGAISTRDYGTTTANFSESQSLVVSLTRAFAPVTVTFPTTVKTYTTKIANSGVGTTPMTISSDPSVTPRDYSESSGAGYRNYDALLNPSPAELMTSDCGLDPANDAPVLGDIAYGQDELPILYYRMDVKYDPQITTNVPVATQWAANATGSFYLASNDYLTKSHASTGSKAFANSSIANLSVSKNVPANLQNLLFQTVGSGSVPRGSFVLISAGADRTYGADPKGNVDDIIVAGGN
jgi:type II secretory pathway pseudopilin PulG